MLMMISQHPNHISTTAVDSSEEHPFAVDEQFELPHPKRQKVSSAELARESGQASASPTADPLPRMVMSETSPTHSKGHDVPVTKDGAKSRPGKGPETASSGPFVSVAGLAKPKRVRTGCLTCRNRHLKCDEAMPICVNCQKSNRKCERGIRLNFIDLKVEHLYTLPPVDWKVRFKDESRQIASEYVGGQERYAPYGKKSTTPPRESTRLKEPQSSQAVEPVGTGPVHPMGSPLGHLHTMHGLFYSNPQFRAFHELDFAGYEEPFRQTAPRRTTETLLVTGSGPTPTSSLSGGGRRRDSLSLGRGLDPYNKRDDNIQPMHSYKSSDVSSVASSLATQAESSSGSFRHGTGSGAPEPHDGLATPQSEKNGERDYLNSADEIYYMQTFVEEVAVWMDCLDSQQHFERIIPYHALKCPMLLNAFLACGVRHLTLIERGAYKDDNSSHYYNTATMQLLRSLQNPERNAAECATTAVVLNMYELMSEQPAERMYHMSGARALIRECGWDAKTTGIGAACFWLNVGMEILSCLAFNWVTEWSPDQWGIDPEEFMSMTGPLLDNGVPISNAERGNQFSSMTNEVFPSSTGSVIGVGEEEIWVHRILYIVANVANFRANIPQREEMSPHDEQVRLQSRFAEWQRLKTWCDTWNAHCPRSMRPFGYLFASSTTSTFPKVCAPL
ncbi:hypothetical protein BD289DRAFT_5506 [Coniella lustricola]|uniref:Zn(2)-C6 fungal-type domain-containing protein n=1 Tax=Coniella lustricola TaxID=2025994 RepID=A0A2T3ANY7_9PEZI|nr:hypothetical protein BD289DRAFT_5506 [Coniella lustricola]